MVSSPFLPVVGAVLSCSSDKSVRVWSIGTACGTEGEGEGPAATCAAVLSALHTDYVRSVCVEPAGSSAAAHALSAGLDATIGRWDLASAQPVASMGVKGSVYALASAGPRLCVAGTTGRIVYGVDWRQPTTDGPVFKLRGHSDVVRRLMVHPSGRLVRL